MKLHSTRSDDYISLKDAINKGIAKDGGLFIFDDFKKVDIEKILELNYHDMTLYILNLLFDDFDFESKIESYPSFKIELKSFKNYSYLELFHGPTLSFKDVALTFLPRLTSASHIFVATSGDTGSATLSGFKDKEDCDVTILYPNNLISEAQEKQMLYFNDDKNKAFAFKGDFDDCQRVVKELSTSNSNLSSANSINIGRLFPQIMYYFYSYKTLINDKIIKNGDYINFVVPTGNFGNILSGYIAKLMGLNINKLICASNENKVLYDFINTGIYDKNREFIKTYSPSMDILVSSNMERLLYLFYKDTNKIKEIYSVFNKTGRVEIKEYKELFKDFEAFYVSNSEVLKIIKDEYIENGYVIDPHTAVAKGAYLKYNNSSHYTVIVSTASPYKFIDTIKKAGVEINMEDAPDSLKVMLKTKNKKIIMDEKGIKDYISGKN